MTLKVQLLVSEWCAPCRGAEEVWQQIAQKKAIAFEVLDVGQREGRAIVAHLDTLGAMVREIAQRPADIDAYQNRATLRVWTAELNHVDELKRALSRTPHTAGFGAGRFR